MTTDLLEDLNENQRLAVTSIKDGNVVVIAGAGSGKTRVLTYTMAYLVNVLKVDTSNILLLTFTNQAANEMKKRVGALVDCKESAIHGGTFHSFGCHLLRLYGRKVKVKKKFIPIDAGDSKNLIDRIRSDLVNDFKRNKIKLNIPSTSTIVEMFSKASNNGVKLRDTLSLYHSHLQSQFPAVDTVRRVYMAQKRKRGYVDFDDMLRLSVRLLARFKGVRGRIRSQFKWILVDEYQDTNLLQARMTRLLVGKTGRFLVVGDDSQCLYSWRGARHTNIFEISDKYPDAKIVKLEQNYRSQQPILDVANAIQNKMSKQFRKTLFTEREGENLPKLVVFNHPISEASFVGAKIAKLATTKKLSDIAVLYRANRDSSFLEVELASRKIPYIKYGGRRFSDSACVKDILSYFRSAFNRSDVLAATRLMSLCRGISERTSDNIWQIGGVKRRARLSKKIRKFLEEKDPSKYPDLRSVAKILDYIEDDNPSKYVAKVIDHYLDLPKAMKKNPNETDLEILQQLSEGYDYVSDLIENLTVDPDSAKNRNRNKENKLVLSTIHSAKGLEWDDVMVIHAHDESIPKVIMGCVADIEEELRVLYVAVTRPKDSLTITCSEENVSPFLRDLPPSMLACEALTT